MHKEAFEPTGLIPRSIIRTFDRFRQQLLPGTEQIAIQEYRISRYQILVSIKALCTLIFVPFLVTYTVKFFFITPVTEHFWDYQQGDIFLNSYQEKRAFNEMHDFSEKIFFESLVNSNDEQGWAAQSRATRAPLPSPLRGTLELELGLADSNSNSDPDSIKLELPSKSSIAFTKPSKRPELAKNKSCPFLFKRGRASPDGFVRASLGQSRDNQSRPPARFALVLLTKSKILFVREALRTKAPLWLPRVSLKRNLVLLGSLFKSEARVTAKPNHQQNLGQLLYSHNQSEAFTKPEVLYSHNQSEALVSGLVSGRVNPWGLSDQRSVRTKPKAAQTRATRTLTRGTLEFGTLELELKVGCLPKGKGFRVNRLQVKRTANQSEALVSGSLWLAISLPERGGSFCAWAELDLSKRKEAILGVKDRVLLTNQDEVNTLNLQTRFQTKSLEIAETYNKQSILAITCLLGDFVTLLTLYILFVLPQMKPQVIILKSFLTESLYSLSDTTKSFLLILGMDLLVGFHSPRGWEIILESALRHFGLPENESFILLFVALFPVFLDTVFKYWIFRYLNKISPSTVVTYHSMLE